MAVTIGGSPKAMNEAYKAVDAELKSMETNMNNLHKHIIDFNNTAWHGGTAANKFYKGCNDNYVNNVKYINTLKAFNNQLADNITYLKGYLAGKKS